MKQTIDATLCVVEMLEMSKHSMIVRRLGQAERLLQGDHVLGRPHGGDELPGEALRRARGALQIVEQVADFRRALEVEPRRRLLHLAP